MKYRLLGKTGVLVSELCFGTMTFGGEADETESALMFKRCREAGVNFFDCANNYCGGRSEEILGKLIQDCRDDVVITTKVSQRVGKGVNDVGGSRRHIMQSVEQSLKRLKTDRIDLYIVHYFDPFTDMEETLRAMDDLVHQGKVLYTGVSNWAAWQIAKAQGIADKRTFSRFECVQLMYNLVKRQAEVELLPFAESEQVGAIVYNPLAAGLLSGKYLSGANAQTGRIAEKEMYSKRYGDPQYYEIAQRFVAYARETGINPVTLAISWVKSHPAVTSPILGARNVSQLNDSLAAADLELTPSMREEISKLSVKPANATDRLEEDVDSKYELRKRS